MGIGKVIYALCALFDPGRDQGKPNPSVWRQGNSDVDRLYDQFGPPLRSFLVQQLRLKIEVEDALTDVLRLLLQYPRTKRLLQADQALRRVALRLCLAAERCARRNSARITVVNHDGSDQLSRQSTTASPSDVLEWLVYREQVRRRLESLGSEERFALLLTRWGYSYKAMAMRRRVSIDSVREYLRRGYSTLMVSTLNEG